MHSMGLHTLQFLVPKIMPLPSNILASSGISESDGRMLPWQLAIDVCCQIGCVCASNFANPNY